MATRKATNTHKVVECGLGHWDEQDHQLDLPYRIDTVYFRVTRTGHDRIERTYTERCANSREIIGFNDKQREPHRRLATFVLFDTKARRR